MRGAERAAFVALVVAVSLAGCRCAGGGAGAACNANGDCAPGLYCDPGAGVCTYVPAGSDARGGDARPGDDAAPGTDAAPPGTDAGPVCGNGILEPGEQCDPVDVACDGTCHFSPSACAGGVGVLMCGSVVMGANDMAGSTDLADDYGPTCASTGIVMETGPEVAYVFVPSESGPVRFDLTGLLEDLDVAVLTGAPPCDPFTCIAGRGDGGTNSENVTIDVVAGQPYWIVVEGYSGSTSTFTLSVDCEPATGG